MATPVTYWLVGRLKAAEEVDFFDRSADFNLFALQRESV